MRHQVAGRKLGRTTSHRLALLRNMATSLFRHERITTTVAKAKELRPFAEKLITTAKRETLHSRRRVARNIQDKEVVAKLFKTLSPRFATRPGGYTRITRIGQRRGDMADMAVIELVDTTVKAEKQKKKEKAGKKVRKPAAPVRKAVRKGKAREEALADVKAAEELKEIEEAEKAEEEAGEQEPESPRAAEEQAVPKDESEDAPQAEPAGEAEEKKDEGE